MGVFLLPIHYYKCLFQYQSSILAMIPINANLYFDNPAKLMGMPDEHMIKFSDSDCQWSTLKLHLPPVLEWEFLISLTKTRRDL